MRTHVFAGLLAVVLMAPLLAGAASMRSGEQVSTGSAERIMNDLYIAAGEISSSATVVGDEYVAGGTIVINGSVSGDVGAVGGNVTILSSVGDDLRIAGGNLIISGRVANDLIAAGGQTHITGLGVGADVLWAGGAITIDAPVTGSVTLRGGEVTINSAIAGHVDFKGDKLTLGPNASIGGNLTYSARKASEIPAGVVKGETKFEPLQAPETPEASTTMLALFGKFLMLLACASAIGLIFNRYAEMISEHAVGNTVAEVARGFVTLVVLPIAGFVLMLTFVGLPIGVIAMLSFAILLIFGMIASPVVLGTALYRWFFGQTDYSVTWLSILVGVIVYTLLGFIPIVGGLIKMIVVLATIGAVVKVHWEVAKNWR